ncbi:MAG: phenylalanine--tRNA ligase subunit beta, partial [Nitrospirae bacterium]|nr:phenylalanine--tRNA ligase subunit beta [Nitrospirota bacterium]
MKASLKWLKEHVSFSQTAAETANALTMAGLEVENIEKTEDDHILEINVTPNRPDCLSITGIARELSAILRLPLKENIITLNKAEGHSPSIDIIDNSLCPRYSSRIIYGVKVGTSPEWLSKRIESHGFRPVNNIVDITNYVLLEMGQPLHAFDLDRLAGGRIVVRTAGPEKKLLTLDKQERVLSHDMLLIWDSEKPVAIAGVMGGLNTEVSSSTVNILLESAYFLPASIRRTSKSLGLSTEASYRFERGADINMVVPALDRVTQLILDISGGKTTGITDIYPAPFTPRYIPVSFKKIDDIIGTSIQPSKVQEILNGLGIHNEIEGKGGGITVTAPGFRPDIQMDVDVVEEIARIFGYNNIPSKLPRAEMQYVRENANWKLIKSVRNLMINSGYTEAVNFSFLNPSVLDSLKLPPEDVRRNFVKIRNPLKKEEEALRTTLVPALLENARLNVSHGERSLRFFEISKVFLNTGWPQPAEALKMAAVCLDDKNDSLWRHKHNSFFDLKGILENLFLQMKITTFSFENDLTQ